MTDKFYIKQYDYERDYDAEDDTLVSETLRRCDLREALAAMNDFATDSEDWRFTEVILYPADNYMDMQGVIHTTHLVIGSTNPRHFDRLGRCYDATCRNCGGPHGYPGDHAVGCPEWSR